MPPLRIIPVIDLQSGHVVRGIAGRRSEYRPIASTLCPGSQPADIARALVEHFSFSAAYVADLDAIAGSEPAWDTYQAIADAGLRLLVDAGLRDLPTAARLLELVQRGTLEAVVVGLETLPHLEQLHRLIEVLNPSRVIFSLDLKDGRPLTQIEAWRNLAPESIAAAAVDMGIERLLILDLARVGTGSGIGTETFAKNLRHQFPDLELIGGGGIRGAGDLHHLASAGYNAALVASALHDGHITRKDLRIA